MNLTHEIAANKSEEFSKCRSGRRSQCQCASSRASSAFALHASGSSRCRPSTATHEHAAVTARGVGGSRDSKRRNRQKEQTKEQQSYSSGRCSTTPAHFRQLQRAAKQSVSVRTPSSSSSAAAEATLTYTQRERILPKEPHVHDTHTPRAQPAPHTHTQRRHSPTLHTQATLQIRVHFRHSWSRLSLAYPLSLIINVSAAVVTAGAQA